jgi:hypothetical protein
MSGRTPRETAPAGLELGAPLVTAEPAALEVRYRRWLRVLPRAYRSAREQEMVDTFLDRSYGDDPENADLTAKFGGVGRGEALSVLALALRLRWADPQAPPRFRVRAAALLSAALHCLTVLAVAASISLCSRLWILLLPPDDLALSPLQFAFPAPRGVWPLVEMWSFVLWIPALVIALSGTRGADGIAALLATVPAVVTVVGAMHQYGAGLAAAFGWALAAMQWSVVLALFTLARTPAGRQPIRRRCYLTAALIGIVGYELLTLAVMLKPPSAVLYPIVVVFFGGTGGPTGFWFIATIVVATALLVSRTRGARPTTSSLLALAALGTATTLLLLTGLPTAWQMFADGEPLWEALFVAAVIQFALAAAITVTAGALAARRIHRLPPVRY